jgi:hypothetical protein
MAGTRPALRALALAALVVGLAGCGMSGAGAAKGSSASTGSSQASAGPSGAVAGDSLAHSHMRVLARLTRAQLCGLVTGTQARRMLGAPAAAPAYASTRGAGITCRWLRRGTTVLRGDYLYIGISSAIDWTGAQALDRRLLHTTDVTVDGHPALATAKQAGLTWVQVDVALGGGPDPVAEYRAPTMAAALALAKAVTPHIIALG